jgi:RPA family protein
MGYLVGAVVPEEADRAQEVYLRGQVEDETGDEISSDDELDEMVAVIA